MKLENYPPIALTIAGSDSGGGAGIQADLKAFSANEVYGASVITAITAQNTCKVSAVHEVPANIVGAQIEAVLTDLNVGAIKIGMLFSPEIIDVVAKSLKNTHIPIVLDPVMIAKSGDALLQNIAIERMIDRLFPLVDLLTPNLPEAAALLRVDEAKTIDEMQQQAEQLLSLGPKSILLKGGHGTTDVCTDLLLLKTGEMLQFSAPRINTKNTHGTGCTYSAAIAAQLAKGINLSDAVQYSHDYLHQAIKAADQLNIGSGHGPVHHFHAIWSAH
ncbi:MAG: bifunctional hydroxymethylpyrimidine kinase/phosphomethylpyrimidine kinase [Gammaproteobacteria bacterium]|nr:MAG: bifunctional hydroxymethylpyrimidine kinase/phosphomethylpyrimidine kinase [Gammaproteobacteria bacterium]